MGKWLLYCILLEIKKMIRNSGFMILISNEEEDQTSVNILH